MAIAQRRVGDVQRPLNRARGAGFPVLGGFDSVLAQVEEVLDSEARRQQRRLLTPAQLVEIVHRVPELFLANIIILDQGTHIFEDAMDDGFKALVAAGNVQAGTFT